MAKKAFIIGANGENTQNKLDFARKDAERIAEHLKDKQYIDVVYISDVVAKKAEVLENFQKLASSCEYDDTIIFMFFGHGVTHNQQLFLLLDSSDPNIPLSCLHIDDITNALETYCKAKNKLIVLDSCHSGAIVNNSKFENVENYSIITAAEEWEEVPEPTDYKDAGFLGYHILNALKGDSPEACDIISTNEGKLTVLSLYKWLQKQVTFHNNKCNLEKRDAEKVPELTLLGKQKGEFEIVKNLFTDKQLLQLINVQVTRLHREENELTNRLRSVDPFENEIEYDKVKEKIDSVKKQKEVREKEFEELLKKLRKKTDDEDVGYGKVKINIPANSHVPSRDKNFIGRINEIKDFVQQLANKETLGITGFRGMGGVGKTAIAIEICTLFIDSWKDEPKYPPYVNENKEIQQVFTDRKFFTDGILWIRFERGIKDMNRLIEKLITQIGGKSLLNKIRDIEDIVRLLYEKDVLIVLDSAEQNTEHFFTLFNVFKEKGFPILITSRERFSGIPMLDIEIMSPDEAVELFITYFKRNVSPTDLNKINTLCKTVGYLPIAIKILASRAEAIEQTIDEIIAEFAEIKQIAKGKSEDKRGIWDILKIEDKTEEELKNLDARVCMSMSFKDLDKETQDVFTYAGIFEFPFTGEALKKVSGFENVNNGLNKLIKLSLISKIKETEITYDLHPLLKEYSKDLAGEERTEKLQNAKIQYYKVLLDDGFEAKNLILDAHSNIISETQAIIDYCQNSKDYENIIRFMDILEEYLYDNGLWEQEKELNRISIKAAISAQNEQKEGWYRLVLADVLGRQNQYEEAIKEFNFSLPILEQLGDYRNVFFIEYALLTINYYKNIYEELSDGFIGNYAQSRKSGIKNYSYGMGLFARNTGWIYKTYYSKQCLINYISRSKDNEAESTNTIKCLHDFWSYEFSIGNFEKAKRIAEKQMEFSQIAATHSELISANKSLIEVYIKIDELEKAEKHLSELEALSEDVRTDDDQNKYPALVALYKKEYETAIFHFSKLTEEGEKNYYLAKTYLSRADNEKGDLINAKTHINAALKHYQDLRNAVEVAKVYTLLAEYDLKRSIYPSAIKHVSIAINTKQKYSVLDLQDENRIKQEILKSGFYDAETIEDAVLPYKDKVIDLEPEFFIKDLPETIIGRDLKEMVLMPEGRSFYGSGEILAFEPEEFIENFADFWIGKYNEMTLANEVYLYPFYIDKNPVCIREYYEFCKATNYPKPVWIFDYVLPLSKEIAEKIDTEIQDLEIFITAREKEETQDLNTDNIEFMDLKLEDAKSLLEQKKLGKEKLKDIEQPITNIEYKAASEYAKWAKKELPSQAEWEKATREINYLFFNEGVTKTDVDKKVNQLLSESTIESHNTKEITEYLIGSDLINFIGENTQTLNDWHKVEEREKKYILSMNGLTQKDISQFSFKDFNFHNLSLNDVQLSILRLLAYSQSLGGYEKKLNTIDYLPKLTNDKVKQLLENLLDEAIDFYRLSLSNNQIENYLTIEKRYWKMVLQGKSGKPIELKVNRQNAIEFTAGNSAKQIVMIGGKIEEIATSNDLPDTFAHDKIGFRCVVPVFSNKDIEKYKS